MALVWKLDLRDGSSIAVGDPWPIDPKHKLPPGQQIPLINAILEVDETRVISGYDDDGDPVNTVYPRRYYVMVLPDDKNPEPSDDTPMPVMRVQGTEVKRSHEMHSWAEVQEIVAEALGLNEEEEDEEAEAANGADGAQPSQPNAPAVQPAPGS